MITTNKIKIIPTATARGADQLLCESPIPTFSYRFANAPLLLEYLQMPLGIILVVRMTSAKEKKWCL